MVQRAAPRNRTLRLTPADRRAFRHRLLHIEGPVTEPAIINRTIHDDLLTVIDLLPPSFVDLLIADPPYNIDKSFNGALFRQQSQSGYAEWLESWLPRVLRVMKPNASVYICGDWRSSAAIQAVAERYLVVRNRITWEREKGRGALKNWKSSSEDVWFCTMSSAYSFNVDAVKLRRRVVAPYREADGTPRGWENTPAGTYRDTFPSNIWTDLTVPFWSMSENTEHPTQKPEKLIAKLILASSNPGDVVLDPFLGSGTTSVVAAKLGRRYVGIETDETYCLLAEKRLDAARIDSNIQGYDGIFFERNSASIQGRAQGEPRPLRRAIQNGEKG